MTERRITQTTNLPHRERRKPQEASLMEVVTFINTQLGDIRAELAAHARGDSADIAKAISIMLKEAFPDGDPGGHRRYHEAALKQAEARAAFWQDMAKSAARWGLLGGLSWLLYVVWTAFIKGPQ